MHVTEWRTFLVGYSATLREQGYGPHDWFGFEPAGEQSIRDAEGRLGLALPKSLRAFYAVTNGWIHPGHFVFDILPVERIGWFRDLQPELCGILAFWVEEARLHPDDQELDAQGPAVLRSLSISSEGDAAWWMLDPDRRDSDGEWRAGMWASWVPGAEWDDHSFAELMQNARSFIERPRE